MPPCIWEGLLLRETSLASIERLSRALGTPGGLGERVEGLCLCWECRELLMLSDVPVRAIGKSFLDVIDDSLKSLYTCCKVFGRRHFVFSIGFGLPKYRMVIVRRNDSAALSKRGENTTYGRAYFFSFLGFSCNYYRR